VPEVVTVTVVDKRRRPVLSACALGEPNATLQQLGITARNFAIEKQCVDATVGVALACRGCGCTEEQACVTPEGPCYWVDADLCSGCAPHTLVLP
jgi:hypothetical protein